MRPTLAVTMGDPFGIGPEILIKAFEDRELYNCCRPFIIGDAGIIRSNIRRYQSNLQINEVRHPDQCRYDYGCLDVMSLSGLNLDFDTPPCPTAESGKAVLKYIETGIDLCMNGSGGRDADALVTAPITKTALKKAGSKFHGHTELLAHRTGADDFRMMLAGDRLKVVLVTIHMALSKVSEALSVDSILKTIQITNESLRTKFSISTPRIAVAGLNPHAGEDSMFGLEEEQLISPAVLLARESGLSVAGPLPPDTVFYKASQGNYDAVVCMYHDQGLIPFKLIHFQDGVNTTLGLPIIRTSVDHGTAYDIVGKGIADPFSLKQAIRMAAFQADNLNR